MIILIFAVSATYNYEVSQHPSISNIEEWPSMLVFAALAMVILLVLYLVWYLFVTMWLLAKCCQMPNRQRATILVNLVLICLSIANVYEGAFTSYYHKASAFVVSLFLFNLYVIILIYLHWPMPEAQQATGEAEM